MVEFLVLIFFAIIIGVPIYIHCLRSKIKEKEYKIQELSGTLQCKNSTISDLEKSVDSSSVRIEQLETENIHLNSLLERATALSLTHQSEISDLQRKSDVLSASLDKLQKVKSDSENAKSRLDSLSEDHGALKTWVVHTQGLCRKFLPQNREKYVWGNNIDCTRLHNAFAEDIQHTDILIRANYTSSKDGTTYETTLVNCTCPDFKFNTQGEPCKHMYTLALELGLFLLPSQV